MATSSETDCRTRNRRLLSISIWVIVAVLVYSAAWFALANYATQKVESVFDGDNPLAAALDCDDMKIAGFPLRLGLNCTKVTINDRRNGILGTAGSFRSSAQIFRPGNITWELDGPAIVQTANHLAATLRWDRMHSNISMGFDGIDSASTNLLQWQANFTEALTGATLALNADQGRVRLKRTGADLFAGMQVTALGIGENDDGPKLPNANLHGDLILLGQAGVLDIDHPEPLQVRGLQGQLNGLVVDMGEGRKLTASGPLTVDNNGLVSGTLKLEVEKVDSWRDMVIAAYPQTKDVARMAAKGLKALFMGQNQGSVTLQITNGVIVLGFIPLGNIPPL
ncbi:DUF2125 domain-containing protein [Rhizobium paknamense]|uniref:DUF2125 domain-containing protein n=1 Tax=Rhizobium paknamense TaxID=1206817 RepID=A0ABU0IEA0_9HYPH|nr:DUF2125 domain-containing protein [Rhizobium paknamense]MDQ0456565.1 hypothetical protein [Rhizobium paknamense]